jgi:hypothetical protein
LFNKCENHKNKSLAKEAFDYNSLVQAWPEIQLIVIKLRDLASKPKDRDLF